MTTNDIDVPASDADVPLRPAAAADHLIGDPDGDGRMTLGQWVRLGVVGGLLVWLTYATGVYGLIMVLGIVVMITLHELGHFVMAKRAGMKVTEFFLGFGPRIWSVRRGETEYGLKLIPAGAYVKIVGMHDIEDVDPADEPRTYRQQPFWQRFGVAVAGSTVHFLLAVGLIFILLVGVGLPGGEIVQKESDWRVGSVSEDSGASRAGLREGDDIVALDGKAVETFDDLKGIVGPRAGEDLAITIERNGERQDLEVTLGENPDDASLGFLGVGGGVRDEDKLGFVEAVPASFEQFGSVAVESIKGLGKIFTPDGISSYSRQVRDAREEPTAVDDVSDPRASSASSAEEDPNETRLLSLLGVFRIGVDAGEAGGFASLMLLFVFINVFIGLFNLVPLLPFDGGHVSIAIYEKVQEWRRRDRRRYLADVGKLIPMTYAVVIVLGLIFVSSLYLDLVNPAQVN
ncbi:MAG TPA: site-2 protease family protein [Iamia sp.]|nr:site-2 protease family protein [Iamia sp.]